MEEDTLRTLHEAIESARCDPAMDRFDTDDDVGGCWHPSRIFAITCAGLGVPYRFRRFLNPPGLRTTHQHVIEVDGVIVDWTYRQVDPGTAWPPSSAEALPLPIC